MSPVPRGLYALEHEPYDEDAPIVVLIHGALDRSAAFGRVVQRLPDLHVVVYDRRGYARSAPAGPREADQSTSLADHAADLVDILDGRPATLVGHSYGGAVAMLAATNRPELVKAVGVFEAPVPWMAWWPTDSAESAGAELLASGRDSAAAAELFIRRQLGDRAWEDLPEPTQAERRAEGPALLADLTSLRGDDPLFDPADITRPIIVGRGSDTVGYQHLAAERLAEATSAPLVDIPGGGHASHVTHPEAFADFVRRTLSLAE